MKCEFCNKRKAKRKIVKYNKYSCDTCYNDYFRPSKLCIVCQEYGKIKSNKNGPVCEKCYKALRPSSSKRPLRTCEGCGEVAKAAKRTKTGHLCKKCYDPPKQICSFCKEERPAHKKQNNLIWCIDCYSQPQRECNKCGEIAKIRGRNLCDDCYEYNQVKCSRVNCNNVDRVAKLENGNPICKRCYDLDWLKIETNRVKQLIRKRIRDALLRPINKKDYNINYKAIIEYLGPKPQDGEYHIDHMFPLFAFDFNNPKHIEKAFAPENHQWLKAEENLKKHNKYDKKAFEAYISQ